MAQTQTVSRSTEKIRVAKDAVSPAKVTRKALLRTVNRDELQRELLIALRDAGRAITSEELVAQVLAQHLHLGDAAARRPVEADVPDIADTLADLLAALPSADGPWGAAIGPVYRTSQVRALLNGVTRQALLDRARRRTLLALRTSDGHTVYPAWQLTGGHVVPGLGEVLQSFAPDDDGEIVDDWTLAAWLRQPLDSLGGQSVATRLVDGDVSAAVQAARTAALRWSR